MLRGGAVGLRGGFVTATHFGVACLAGHGGVLRHAAADHGRGGEALQRQDQHHRDQQETVESGTHAASLVKKLN